MTADFLFEIDKFFNRINPKKIYVFTEEEVVGNFLGQCYISDNSFWDFWFLGDSASGMNKDAILCCRSKLARKVA